MKKLFFVLVTFFVLTVANSAFAYEDSGKCGDNLSWYLSYDGNYSLEIKGSGDMYDYSYNTTFSERPPWQSYRSKITSVTLPEGITSIGAGAFYGFDLYDVVLPEGIEKIGDYSFFCAGINTIDIPDTVKYIGNHSFTGCYFEEISIPDSVESIGESAFSQSALVSVNLGGNLCHIAASTFYQCKKLEAISLSGNIAGIDEKAFYECSALKTADLGSNISTIGKNAFYNCKALETVRYHSGPSFWEYVTVESGNDYLTKRVKSYGKGQCGDDVYWEFSNTILTFSGTGKMYDFDKGIINENSDGYSNYLEDIEYVIILENIENIGSWAISNMPKLKSVFIGKDVQNIGEYTFVNCELLSEILVHAENSNFTSLDGILFSKEKTELIKIPQNKAEKEIVIPNTVNVISENAFSETALEKIYYIGTPEEFESIDIKEGNEVLFNSDIIKFTSLPIHINSLNCTYDSGIVNADIKFDYLFEECIVFFAIYDTNGKFITVKSDMFTDDTSTSFTAENDYTGYTVKAFCRDNIGSLKPLSNAAETLIN